MQGTIVRLCKTINEIDDDSKNRILTNHEVPTTEYTLLQRSNFKSSKCSLDKDIVYSKGTNSWRCLLCVFFVIRTKRQWLGHFVNSGCSKSYKINEKITEDKKNVM